MGRLVDGAPLGDAHPSLSEAVYRKLLSKLLAGAYPAGARLREERLCAELGVSRTPLREALIRLVREGFLEQQPRRGCLVRPRRENELADLMEARSLLEGLLLRTYFQRLDLAGLRELEARLAGPMPPSGEEILAVDEALHDLIHAACPNRLLVECVKRYALQCRPYRVHRSEGGADRAAMAEERLAILRAILSGDAHGAAEALARHFRVSEAYFGEAGRN